MEEPYNPQTYDLFISILIGAWAGDRVLRDGHWHFEDASDDMRTIHHVGGGQFLVNGIVAHGYVAKG